MTIWVTFYSAIWQDNLICSEGNTSTHSQIHLSMVVRPWWTCICMASPPADDVCAVALVVGGDISVTHLTIGKSLAKILQKYAKILAKYRWHTWQWGNLRQKYCTLVARLVSLGIVFIFEVAWGLTGISSSLIHGTHACLSEERKHDLSPGHGHKCIILDVKII